jgi:hypothetical protein
MKVKGIIAAILVAVMICTAFASCGNKVVSKVHIKFVVTVDEDGNPLDDEKVIGETDVEVEGTTSNPPTVLKAAQLALGKLSYEDGFETTADGYSIARIKTYEEHQETDEDTGYYTYWDAYIDGQRSTSGRQSETPIYDGSELEFRFISDSTPREDNQKYTDET